MKEKELKTHLKLNKSQLQTIINEHLVHENGLNDMFEMLLNGLMYAERSSFLETSSAQNKGNGYRSVKKSGIGSKLQLQIPRDRLGVFKPVVLGLLNEQEEQIKDLSFSLYGKGLTTRQISSVLEDVYGNNYSKSTVSRITTDFYGLMKSWMQKPLDSNYLAVFIDAVHLKVRRDTVATEAFYIVLGVKEDYTREVLGVINFPHESATGWEEVLEGLKQRGLKTVDLFVFDDLTALDTSVGKAFPKARQQKCILHFQRSLSKRVRRSDREAFCGELKRVFDPDNKDYKISDALQTLKAFLLAWSGKYSSLRNVINRPDLELLFTYLKYDYRIRRMIYTTNWIERLNKSIKRTTKIRNALPTEHAALTLIAYAAMDMEENTYKYPIVNFKFEYENRKVNY